jgi:hypothetical protein
MIYPLLKMQQNTMQYQSPLAFIVGTFIAFFNGLFGFINLPTTYEGKILQAFILGVVGFIGTKLGEIIYKKYIKKK